MENEVVINADIRTPERIVGEINEAVSLGKQLLRTVAFRTVLRVGALLIEAKELVPHGEWEPWIKANMVFTPRSASTYMKYAKTYGESLENIDISNRKVVSDLPFTDAMTLLSFDDREEIFEAIDAGRIAPEDLSAEIQRLKEEKEQLEMENDKLISQNADLEVQMKEMTEDDDRAARIFDGEAFATALKEAEELRAKVSDYDQKIEKLKAEQKKLKDKQAEAVREATDKEISALRKDIEEQASAASKEEMAKLEERLKTAEDRAARAEKEKELAASEEKTSFLIVMKDMQVKFYAALELSMSTALPDEDREKMKAALLTVLDALRNSVG